VFHREEAVNYTLVSRNKSWPIELKQDKSIEQGVEKIGFFTSTGIVGGQDSYEFLFRMEY
jgi:hypothetical protein